MSVWFTEDQVPGLRLSCRVSRVLHQEKTPFQHLAILETEVFGRVLTLDGIIQTTEHDEFIYHELIAHVAMCAHRGTLRRVLIIGGGDGGTMRQVLRHRQVTACHLVEIDERVVAVAREFLPALSAAMDDPRAKVIIADGIEYVRDVQEAYDLIIVDSTDPIGPAVGLFSADFYAGAHRALAVDGMCVAQTESAFHNARLVPAIFARMAGNFPIARLYLGAIPSYPGGPWSFTVGSKLYDPAEPVRPPPGDLRYYSPDVHRAAFALPPYVVQALAHPPS
ncbi:MAG TPA: spermidine synthase [Clostridiales bacterium UBA8153]|nr:spermidine synthase [Clostridiales bacterium UBA8153]